VFLLPSLFTAANIYAGYYAIVQSIQGSPTAYWHFDHAAIAIGFAILFDGLDGRIARMTNTTSDFGREFDSLADVITFGVAPSVLAWMWGFRFLPNLSGVQLPEWLTRDTDDPARKLAQLGLVACFVYVVAGASRLARFNIDKDPKPSNPGKPGRKYFVGMPIPEGAGVIAAVVHFFAGRPVMELWQWWESVIWGVLVVCLGLLMVSTWRFPSPKQINLRNQHPFPTMIAIGAVIAGIVYFSGIVLLVLAFTYMFWGVGTRMAYAARRTPPAQPLSEQPQS
jgi:CDP-diacylglycerol---serine O-phosphatidyltransferase